MTTQATNQSATTAATTSAATTQLFIARHRLRVHGDRQRAIWLGKVRGNAPDISGKFQQMLPDAAATVIRGIGTFQEFQAFHAHSMERDTWKSRSEKTATKTEHIPELFAERK